ncbi:MAG: hypothetical protein ACPHJ3_18000, partial [Rubripirellula sp.]
SMDLIMPFFIEAMEKLGYAYDKTKYERSQLIAGAPIKLVVFTKEKLKFSVRLTKLQQQQTEITLNFVED